MSSTTEELKGTWREPSGEKVSSADAREAWAEAARPVLLGVADRYGEYMSYKELSERVQDDSGIRTTQQMHHWIGKVLTAVGDDCGKRGEPLLSAFCVHADETVGVGYAKGVLAVYGFLPEDPDAHAAEERLKAHRFFKADMPADGGSPRLPPRIARQRSRVAAQVERPMRPMCPNCFVEMPVNGPCGLCG